MSESETKAWVVFSPQADMPWLKILKPGFRHCAVLLNDGRNWITIDPLSNYMDVSVHQVPLDFDLPEWMCGRGHIVMAAPLKRPPRPAPVAVYSCVSAVKHILGIHKRFIVTPWQLYRHLQKLQSVETFKPKGDLAWEV